MPASQRFLPSFSQVHRAAQELPNPESFSEETIDIPIGRESKQRVITFHRIKYASRSSGKTVRWVYKGGILIRSATEKDES
ncbi:MAG: hypothetical protein AAGF10_06705 [Verrucomicrobiota bacterium]